MRQESLQENYSGVFGTRIGFGRSPAVAVVDFINAYTTPGAPLYAPPVVDAVRETVDLLELARRKGVLVVYTRVLYASHGMDGGIFLQKVPTLRGMVEGEPLAEIVPELPPAPQDVIINKQYASAFFGTSLATLLTSQGVDTLILTGGSTNGCIRASAVDGMQYDFRVMVRGSAWATAARSRTMPTCSISTASTATWCRRPMPGVPGQLRRYSRRIGAPLRA